MQLEALFQPRSIAVIGASEKPTVGRRVVASLDRIGFTGRISPVNPSYPIVLGHACCASMAELPEEPDVAVFCLGHARVLGAFVNALSLFAAAVIMRLVEAGKLDLDEAMATYDPDYQHWCQTIKDLPEARNYNCAAERITVRHHLTHTAQGKPGTTYAYNGFLFARLSAVVDAVSPRGFKRAVEEDILEPLGMRDTALGAGDPNKAAVIARMAKPYALNRDWTLTPPAVLRPPLDYFSAASGLISTVVDLAKYDVAIDRDQVYSSEAKRQVWTPMQSPTGERFPYGLGWFVWELPSRAPMPWHYGYYTDASSALLLKVPDRQLSLILLASSDRASSPFGLGSGNPARSPFVTALLDAVGRGD